MVLVPLLAAPTLMLAATAAERRFGAAVAGAVAALPVALSIIVLAVGAELGRDAGATLAAGAAAHVVAQVAFALTFAALVTRHGGTAGLLAGIAAFALLSLLVALVPQPLAIATALPALLLGSQCAPVRGSDPFRKFRLQKKPCSERDRFDPWVGGAVAFVVVGAALVTAELLGPAAAGTIGAFPALSATLALVLLRSRGAEAAAAALGGLIGGLRAYLVFAVIVAVGAPVIGVFAAVAVGLGACGLTSIKVLSAAPENLDL